MGMLLSVDGQEITVKGFIKSGNQPLASASIGIKNSYDGATSDSTGYFLFKTSQATPFWLTVSALGYHRDSIFYNPDESADSVTIQLHEEYTTLNTVSISAGNFASGLSNKGITLSAIEIATIAGASADIYDAMRTLPGAGVAFGETGLSVRGGSPTETKMYIDGMMVKNPFNGQLPNISARGRFSAFQFKNTAFSTGGYSAQYGQALSSILSQETRDLPEKTYTRLTALSVGAELEQFIRHKNSGIVVFGNYYNLSTSNRYINPQQVNWSKDPEQGTAGLQFMQKTGKEGLLKLYADHSTADMGIQQSFNPLTNALDNIRILNRNTYFNGTYSSKLAPNWKFLSGISYQENRDNLTFDQLNAQRNDRVLQARALSTFLLGDVSAIRFGAEFFLFNQSESFDDNARSFQDQLAAAFLEGDIYFSKKLVLRAGLRAENSVYLKQQNIAPRGMLAYKTGGRSQVAMSYGLYFQLPDDEYLIRQPLHFQQSKNVTLNYEYMDEGYTFRSELYYKNYNALVKDFGTFLNNTGHGFAKGIDIFWRDRKTIKNLEYRLSYSYLDSERDFRDYPLLVQPTFVSKHTLNILYRQYVKPLSTQLFTTYTFASGRTFYNPNSEAFLGERSPDYQNFSLGANFFASILKQFTVFFLNVDNILGIRQVYGYTFDQHRRHTVLPPAKRTILLGTVISIGDNTFRQD